MLEVGELRRRREGECSLAPVRRHGASPLFALRCMDDELPPARRIAHADAAATNEVAVDRALGVVLGALLGRELDRDPLGVVLRQVVAGELDDVLAVRDRADEGRELRLATVAALGSRREPQAKGREARARRERVARPRQVVALVEDDEAEPGAEVLHVQERRVVGRDGDRLHVVLATADEPDRAPEGRAEQVEPLSDQVERGRDDERAAALVVDGEERHVALAGPRGQDDDAATAVSPPRRQSLGLVGSRIAVDASAPGKLRVPARSVVVRRLRGHERAHHVGVRSRRGAVTARARVPCAGRWWADSVRPAAHFERAGHEGNGDHRRMASTEGAGVARRREQASRFFGGNREVPPVDMG